jgi:hypothetical protein
MSKSNKQYRTIDEKQHHVFNTMKRENFTKAVKTIDQKLKAKRYEDLIEEEKDWDEDRHLA